MLDNDTDQEIAADPNCHMFDCRSRSPAWSSTFMEIDHEIISIATLLPSAASRRVVVNYTQKYIHKVPSKPLSQACPEKHVVR